VKAEAGPIDSANVAAPANAATEIAVKLRKDMTVSFGLPLGFIESLKA
jgi:hypothetical protein